MSENVKEISDKLLSLIEEADSIAIIGHVHPDGDCMGSNLAMMNYIIDNYEGKTVDVYDEVFSESFKVLAGHEKVKHEKSDKIYDLAISIDVSDLARLSTSANIFDSAKHTVCIDHHVSNPGFGELCYVAPDASSACEAMCDLIELDKVSERTANCLYLGMVHDTGVFKYSSTSKKTMELAGLMIEKGAKPEIIIDETFYKKTYKQNKLMARVVMDSVLHEEGKLISGFATKDIFDEYGCTSMDTDGIVEQLRLTDGVEVAAFAYQLKPGEIKFSLRAKSYVDVNVIANTFGGGGHVRAAGFTTTDSFEEALAKVIELARLQLK